MAKDRAWPGRLPDAYAFSWEYDTLRERIAQPRPARDVHVQSWELEDELVSVAGLKSRWDKSGPKRFRIVGDELVSPDDTISPAGLGSCCGLSGLGGTSTQAAEAAEGFPGAASR